MNLNWLKKNKTLLIIMLILLSCIAIGWIVYGLYGRQLIRAMYEGESIGILNRIIEGQAMRPVKYYFNIADRLFFKFRGVLFLIILAVFCSSIKFKLKMIVLFIFVYGFIYLTIYNLDLETNPDSTNYISCAEHLLQGKGFYSTGFDQANYDKFMRTGIWEKPPNNKEIHPYTHWGPLYPVLLAILMRTLNINALTAAVMINWIFFSILITMIYLILVKIDSKKLRVVVPITVIVLICFKPFGSIFNFAGTDITYIGLSISAIFLMQKFYSGPQNKESTIILFCAIFTSLALLCKYIGITLLITGLILILLKNGFAMTKRKLINCLVFSSISVLLFLPWLIRNKMLTGFLGGGNRGPSGCGVFYNLYLTIKVMARDFLFTDNKYIISFVLLFLLVLAIYKRNIIKVLVKKYLAFIIYPFLYLASIIMLRSVIHFDTIRTRITVSSYPFIIIVGFAFFYRFFNDILNKNQEINY